MVIVKQKMRERVIYCTVSTRSDKKNYISAIDVINDDFDKKRIENKIILDSFIANIKVY